MQSPKSVQRPVPTRQQRELEDVRQKRSNLADCQHCYAAKRVKASKRRAAELQESERDREKDEQVISEMEKEVTERRQVNASNQENLEEVKDELRQIEVQIDADREALLKRVKEFQEYLEKQLAEEKDEVTQLKAEQDELATHEQQLLSTIEDDEIDNKENERARQSLNDQLRNPMQGQGLLTRSPTLTLTDPTNEQLKAELERVQSPGKSIDRHLRKQTNCWLKRRLCDKQKLETEFFIGMRMRSWRHS